MIILLLFWFCCAMIPPLHTPPIFVWFIIKLLLTRRVDEGQLPPASAGIMPETTLSTPDLVVVMIIKLKF